jgi:histone H3/H4
MKPPLPPPIASSPTSPKRRLKKRASVKRDFDSVSSGRGLGTRALLCIPRVTFRRLVEEIAAGYKSDLRIQQEAIDTLQEDAELLLVERFKRCSRLAEICRRDTVRDEHWNFVREDEESLALPYLGRS